MKEYGAAEEVPVCPDCGRKLTPAERLLCAIFNDRKIRCQECYRKSKLPKCTKCGKTIEDVFYYEGSPYHAWCLPLKEY